MDTKLEVLTGQLHEANTRIEQIENNIAEYAKEIRMTPNNNFFNNFFVSVFSSEPEFSTNDYVYHSYTGESIQDFSCTEADVEKLLLGLNTNKACGPDGITARMLRESASTIAPSLSRIFNISLKLGKLPSEWKSANITPVFKKGVKETVTNHRPISLTCLVVKVLEKPIAKSCKAYFSLR